MKVYRNTKGNIYEKKSCCYPREKKISNIIATFASSMVTK